MGKERLEFSIRLDDLFRKKERKKYQVAEEVGLTRITISKYVNASHCHRWKSSCG